MLHDAVQYYFGQDACLHRIGLSFVCNEIFAL